MAGANNWVPAVVFGTGLVLLGGAMMLNHQRVWRRQQGESLDHLERHHFAGQYQRRMQTSGMLGLTGLLIAAGDVFIWSFGPVASTAYWGLVLLLVCWIGLLAMGDIAAIQAHNRTEAARMRARQQLLEAEYGRIQRDLPRATRHDDSPIDTPGS